MNIITRLTNIITTPKEEFESIKKETTIKEALIYLIPLTIFFTASKLTTGMPSQLDAIKEPITKYILYFIASIAALYIVTFAIAGILHYTLKIFKNNNSFIDVYKTIAYGATPYMLLGWMPLISIITVAFMVYLHVIGINTTTKITIKETTISYVIMAVALIAIVAIIGLI